MFASSNILTQHRHCRTVFQNSSINEPKFYYFDISVPSSILTKQKFIATEFNEFIKSNFVKRNLVILKFMHLFFPDKIESLIDKISITFFENFSKNYSGAKYTHKEDFIPIFKNFLEQNIPSKKIAYNSSNKAKNDKQLFTSKENHEREFFNAFTTLLFSSEGKALSNNLSHIFKEIFSFSHTSSLIKDDFLMHILIEINKKIPLNKLEFQNKIKSYPSTNSLTIDEKNIYKLAIDCIHNNSKIQNKFIFVFLLFIIFQIYIYLFQNNSKNLSNNFMQSLIFSNTNPFLILIKIVFTGSFYFLLFDKSSFHKEKLKFNYAEIPDINLKFKNKETFNEVYNYFIENIPFTIPFMKHETEKNEKLKPVSLKNEVEVLYEPFQLEMMTKIIIPQNLKNDYIRNDKNVKFTKNTISFPIKITNKDPLPQENLCPFDNEYTFDYGNGFKVSSKLSKKLSKFKLDLDFIKLLKIYTSKAISNGNNYGFIMLKGSNNRNYVAEIRGPNDYRLFAFETEENGKKILIFDQFQRHIFLK